MGRLWAALPLHGVDRVTPACEVEACSSLTERSLPGPRGSSMERVASLSASPVDTYVFPSLKQIANPSIGFVQRLALGRCSAHTTCERVIVGYASPNMYIERMVTKECKRSLQCFGSGWVHLNAGRRFTHWPENMSCVDPLPARRGTRRARERDAQLAQPNIGACAGKEHSSTLRSPTSSSRSSRCSRWMLPRARLCSCRDPRRNQSRLEERAHLRRAEPPVPARRDDRVELPCARPVTHGSATHLEQGRDLTRS